MLLSILIPTFNREKFIIKNLNELSSSIREIDNLNNIQIIISDNHSTDKTVNEVNNFINSNKDIKIKLFQQEENIGLEKNALFTLQKANTDYIMFLGDDDYLHKKYLHKVIEHLENNISTFSIIPSITPINIDGRQLGPGRDEKMPNRLVKAGFYNCLLNSWRGHQLSGLTLKRLNLYDSYIRENVNNIYLFIYFVAYTNLHGATYNLTEFPVKVTDPGQSNKDWNYGDDGLVSEIFDNYKKLFKNNHIKRFLLEINLLYLQYWRYFNYLPNSSGNKTNSYRPFFSCVSIIQRSNNTTLLTSLFFPLLIIFIKIKLSILVIYQKMNFKRIK